MFDKMKMQIVLMVFQALFKMLSPEKVMEFFEGIADKISKKVAGSNNKVDDVILGIVTGGEWEELIDYTLDFLEAKILGSASTVDDALVLPLIVLLRQTFGIDDFGGNSFLPR